MNQKIRHHYKNNTISPQHWHNQIEDFSYYLIASCTDVLVSQTRLTDIGYNENYIHLEIFSLDEIPREKFLRNHQISIHKIIFCHAEGAENIINSANLELEKKGLSDKSEFLEIMLMIDVFGDNSIHLANSLEKALSEKQDRVLPFSKNKKAIYVITLSQDPYRVYEKSQISSQRSTFNIKLSLAINNSN